MRDKLIVVIVLAFAFHIPAKGAEFTLVSHDGNTSYLMPSLSPWMDYDGIKRFKLAFVEALYDPVTGDFADEGDIYSGLIQVGTDGVTWIGGVPDGAPLNGGEPIKLGLEAAKRWQGFSRPMRRGNMAAWVRADMPEVHMYDFASDTGPYLLESFGQCGVYNPKVSNGISSQTVCHWALESAPSPDNPNSKIWSTVITGFTYNGSGGLLTRNIIISEAASSNSMYCNWARVGDIYSASADSGMVGWEGNTGRTAFTQFVPGIFGLEVKWSAYDLGAGTYSAPQTVVGAGANDEGRIDAVVMSGQYLVWEKYGYSQAESGTLFAAKWDVDTQTYQFMEGFSAACLGQEPSLFGSYLVYVGEDGDDILMRNLSDLSQGAITLVQAPEGKDLQWPAIWVDENTGDYVIIYQQMGSPSDLMIATNIPEPAMSGLLAAGGIALLSRRRSRRGR